MKKGHLIILSITTLLVFLSSFSLNGQSKKVIIRGDDNYPPFEFINEHGEADGFNIDLFKEIISRTGLDCDLKLINWSDAISGFNDGSIDVLTGTTNNHDWGEDVLFGIPYYTITLSITSRRNDNYTAISELVGKKLIIRGGTWSESFLNNNDIAGETIVINDLESALKVLSSGKYDALLNSTIGTLYSIKRLGIPNLAVNSTFIREEDFSFCVHGKSTDILYAMNKALDQMKMDGTYDKLYNKWFSVYSLDNLPAYIWYLIVGIAVLALVLVFVVIRQQNREKHMSHDLSKSKQWLKEKNDQLELVLSAGSIIPLYWNIEKDRIYVTSNSTKVQYSNFDQEAKYVSLDFAIGCVHPDDQRAVRAVFDSIIFDEKEDVMAEARYDVNKAFDKCFAFHLVVNSHDRDGKPTSAVGYMQDITERKKSEEVLRQSEAFLTNILNAIPFPVEVKDVEGEFKYAFWNDQSTKEYGDLHYKNLSAILPQDKVDEIHKIDMEVYNTGKVYFNHETLLTLDGKVHQTVVQKSPIMMNGKRMILIVRWDIGNIKELEKSLDIAMKKLEEAKNEADQANQLKSAFLANMSHEIRTPLNAIVGFSQLMSTAESDEEKEEYSSIIKTNSDSLLSLISDILDLSKIEAGYIEIKRTDYDLAKLFRMLYTTFTQRMKPGVELILGNPYETCFIHSDKNRMTQVVTNFMTNAIKFTEKGSITMGYKALDEKTIRFWVTDTGCGISEENRPKIFGRFERVNYSIQGNGLGLSICKTIVETAGGTIGFDSQEGKGSTFWVEFPTKITIGKL